MVSYPPRRIPLTKARKLYEILGETIGELYGQNNGCGDPLPLPKTLRKVIKLETDLVKWRRQLPNELLVQACSPSAVDNEQALIFERLSTIMTLRYLNARVLLHRPVLSHFLRHTYESDLELEGNDFLLQCSRNSLQVCLDSAAEIIATMETAVTRPYMLGAWWFSLYYSQFLGYPSTLQSSLITDIAFNAALTVFGGLLIGVHDRRIGDDHTQASLKRSLDLAVTALQNLGGGVRLAKRCSRYLEALSKVASSLSEFKDWSDRVKCQLADFLPSIRGRVRSFAKFKPTASGSQRHHEPFPVRQPYRQRRDRPDSVGYGIGRVSYRRQYRLHDRLGRQSTSQLQFSGSELLKMPGQRLRDCRRTSEMGSISLWLQYISAITMIDVSIDELDNPGLGGGLVARGDVSFLVLRSMSPNST